MVEIGRLCVGVAAARLSYWPHTPYSCATPTHSLHSCRESVSCCRECDDVIHSHTGAYLIYSSAV